MATADHPPVWRALVAVSAALAMMFIAVGCTDNPPTNGATEEPQPEVASPRNGGHLVVALADDTTNWNPAASAWTPSEFEVGRAIYDRLAVYSDSHELLPELAKSIDHNSDFTEWTITLRANIVFHDGSALDAAALKMNLEAQQLSPVAGPLLVPVKSIFVTGPLTARISMRTPWSTFPHLLTSQAGFVASPATLSSAEGAAHPIGTGPFVFNSANPGQSLETAKNSSYWRDGLPRLDAVSFRVIPDGKQRSDALVKGRVDLVLADDPVTITDLRTASTSGSINLLLDRDAEAPKLTFVFNTARPPFLDPVARHAVVSATDRPAMTAAGYDGVLVPAKGPISDQSVWFIDQALQPRDVEQAKKDATRYEQIYGIPLTFTLDVPLQPVFLRFAAMWQRQLREAGIEMTIRIMDEAAVRAATAIGDFEAAMLPMFGEWHPDEYYAALHRAQMTPVGAPGLNYPRFGTDGIDKALDDARKTGELATQVDAYRKVQNDLATGNAYLFLLRLPQAVAAQADVKDLTEWTTASGASGLAQERGTVSLTYAWLDRPDAAGE
jgi:peptide/nickel transport system substrate-binding protein